MTLDPLLSDYQDHLERLGRSAKTRVIHRRWLQFFARFCQGEGLVRADQLYPCHLDRFRQSLLWHPGPTGRLYSPNTVDQALRVVRSFLRWATAQGHLREDPSRCLVLPRPPQPSQRILTVLEVQTLLEAPDPTVRMGLRDRAVLEAFYALPIDPRELCQLDVGDLVLPERLLHLRQGPDGPSQHELSDRLVRAFDGYLHQSRPQLTGGDNESALLLSTHGTRLQKAALLRVLKEHSRRAGLGSVTFRTLRRSFGAHADAFCESRIPALAAEGGLL